MHQREYVPLLGEFKKLSNNDLSSVVNRKEPWLRKVARILKELIWQMQIFSFYNSVFSKPITAFTKAYV